MLPAATRIAPTAVAVALALCAADARAQTSTAHEPGATPGVERVVVAPESSTGERVTVAAPGATEPGGDTLVGIRTEPVAPGRFVLWGTPLPTLFYAASGALAVHVGADLPLSSSVAIVLEGGLLIGKRNVFTDVGTGAENSVTFDSAVGLAWVFFNHNGTGPVVQPKFAVEIAQLNEVLGAQGRSAQAITALVGPGLNLGFQFTTERVRVTLTVGVSIGYCYCVALVSVPGSLGTQYELRRTGRWEPGFDLDLIRAGIAF